MRQKGQDVMPGRRTGVVSGRRPRALGWGRVVPKEEEHTWREMLFLELLLHTV